ncbi:MAG: putative sulfate exporter family transporter [Sphingopyxis sp.]
MNSLVSRAQTIGPGVIAALIVAAAANFLSEHYTAPVMLYALLLGMTVNFLTEAPRSKPGIDFASTTLLRIGVALLGLRIGWEQVMALGWMPVAMVVGVVTLTIGVSVLLARAMGFNPLFGLLSGGATAICGASAAMALAATLPAHEKKEQATLFTVIGVSVLSTLAMIAYPLVARWTGLNDHQAGMFIGATIHDVAQVVGAGYAISPDAGDTATIVKLLRVAMLLPVILVAGQVTRSQAAPDAQRPPLLPWFVVAFVVLMIVNSVNILPRPVVAAGDLVSRGCLIAAIAAIGIKTRLGEIARLGIKPVLLMFAETLFLAMLVLLILKFAPL